MSHKSAIKFLATAEPSPMANRFKSTSRKRSSVSFSPTSVMCFVSNHENKSDLFYSVQEIDMIKLRRWRDCHNLMEYNIKDLAEMLGNVVDTSAFIGLEICLSKSTYMEVIQKRRAIVVAVLSEQHRQVSLGIHDLNTLANISAAQSAWARERARTIALIHSK